MHLVIGKLVDKIKNEIQNSNIRTKKQRKRLENEERERKIGKEMKSRNEFTRKRKLRMSNDDVRKGIGDEYIFTDRWTQTDEIL